MLKPDRCRLAPATSYKVAPDLGDYLTCMLRKERGSLSTRFRTFNGYNREGVLRFARKACNYCGRYQYHRKKIGELSEKNSQGALPLSFLELVWAVFSSSFETSSWSKPVALEDFCSSRELVSETRCQ